MTAAEKKPRDTLLIALDGSLAAATALPIAFAVAAQLGADCQALHIVSESGLIGDLSRPFAQRFEALSGIKLWPEVIESTVRLWRAFAGPENALLKALAHMELRLEAGDPAAGILRASADPLVALVVLTTHGHIIEPGRSLGRVAEQVIAGARQPILLIRPEATPLAIRPRACCSACCYRSTARRPRLRCSPRPARWPAGLALLSTCCMSPPRARRLTSLGASVRRSMSISLSTSGRSGPTR